MAFLKKLFRRDVPTGASKKKTEPAKKAEPVSDVKEKSRDALHASQENVETPHGRGRRERSASPKGASPKTVAAPQKKTSKKKDYSGHKILLRPLITEKATDLAQFNKYAFAVSKNATKPQVVEAMRNTYGVTPVKVNVIRFQGKKVRHGRRTGKTKSWKKAIITLRSEDRIEIYEGV